MKTKNQTFNKIVKCKLITILKNPLWMNVIQDRVDAVNKIRIELYFLLNQYILKMLVSNTHFELDKNTVERMALFVLKRYENIRNKDDEYKRIKMVYTQNYLPISANKLNDLSPSLIDTISYPFNYIATEILTNIKNHVSLNFKRNNKYYIRSIVNSEFKKDKLSKSLIMSIINCIMYNVANKNNDKITIYSDKLAKHNNIDNIAPKMLNVIKKIKSIMPESIKKILLNLICAKIILMCYVIIIQFLNI